MSLLWMTTIPRPDPLAQAAPGWLFWALLLVTFVLHVLPMNFVLGGSVIAAVARLRAGRTERGHPEALVGWMAKAMPVAVAAAITFGVAALLFLQVLYGRLFFTSSVLMAGWWLSVIPLVVIAYYGAYLLVFRGKALGALTTVVAWTVAVALLVIAFLYTNNMTLMLQPGRFVEVYTADGRGLHLNLDDPTLVPRYLHMLLGALAVAGLTVTVYGQVVRRRDREFGDWALRHGALWFAGATAPNLVVGFWWLLALPRPALLHFMSHAPAIALFLGVTVGLVTLTLAVLAARAADPAPHARWMLVGLLVTLPMMVISRDQVRTASLARADFTPTSWVEPQWAAISVFVVLLVAAALTITWMALALARGADGPACVNE